MNYIDETKTNFVVSVVLVVLRVSNFVPKGSGY